jgi:hypothetical protein
MGYRIGTGARGDQIIAEAWDAAGLYQVGSFVGDSWKECNGEFRDDVRSFFQSEAGQFISDIDSDQDRRNRKRVPLCVHIAAHGNKDGLGFGRDLVEWDESFDNLKPSCAMRHYDGDFVLVISACNAAEQQLTTHFEKKAGKAAMRPPVYLVTTADPAPTFPDALVSWVVFYHQLPRVSLTDNEAVKNVLRRVKAAGAITVKYSR